MPAPEPGAHTLSTRGRVAHPARGRFIGWIDTRPLEELWRAR